MDDAATKSKEQKRLQPRAKEAWNEVSRLEKEYQRISLVDATFPYREGYEQNDDEDVSPKQFCSHSYRLKLQQDQEHCGALKRLRKQVPDCWMHNA